MDRVSDRLGVIAVNEPCVGAELGTNVALMAAEICARYRLSTAGAIIYATA